MYSKILILRFPKTEVQKPLVCHLTRNFDLTFIILNAGILPRKEGYMVLELSGQRKNFKEGVLYLKSQGVDVQNASQEVKREDTICTQCGACTAVCPTGAMRKRAEDGVVFVDEDLCVGCKTCISACPWGAPQWHPRKGKVVKCDYCQDRLAKGLQPACVTICPTGCLQFGKPEDMPNIRRVRYAKAMAALDERTT